MLLKKAQEMEIEKADDGEGNITDLFDTFTVADKIAGRLRDFNSQARRPQEPNWMK